MTSTTTPLTPLRYDSPTVTLEVMAREAAVSQWSDKPVVQVWRYQLHIRDLSGQGEAVDIRGDRATFLPLTQAVEDYVQAQLTGTDTVGPSPPMPYLEPQGLTQHRLHLGSLRTATGAATVMLGAVQLADLGDVLDQLQTQVRPLPVSLTAASQRRPWRQWGAAAAGIVAAVGVTTVLWPHYQTQQRVGDTALEAPTADRVPEASQELDNMPRSPQPQLDTPAESTPEATVPETVAPANQEPAVAESESESGVGDETAPPAETTTAPPPPTPRIRTAPPSTSAPATESAPAAKPAPPRTAPPAPTPEPEVATRPTPGAEPDDTESGESDNTGEPHRTASGVTADTAPESFSTNEESLSQRAAPAEAPLPEPGSLAALVEQVRDRWTPPAVLDQTLTYTLVFAADGTLTEVIPADDLAEQYRDLTGIPDPGTEWLPSGDPETVQLLLYPDGDVAIREVASD